jgi:hypothetical protein
LKLLLAAVGILLLTLVAILGIGAALPRFHEVSRTAQVEQPPDVIWAAITGTPNWRRNVKKYDVLPPLNGRRHWREIDQHGTAITYVEERAEKPHLLVTRIADDNLPFGGTWTYEIKPMQDGSTVTITERGEVKNPIYRFVSKFVIGQGATLEEYLRALSARFGQPLKLVQ